MFRDWMDRMGFSQRDAAEALGVSVGKINALAKGAEPGLLIQLACEALERRVVEPAAAPPPAPDIAELRADLDRAWERLAEYGERLSALNKGTLPATIRDDIVRRYEYHAQQQQQRIQARMNAAAALTDDEREEADKARRAIAKARQIAQGEPWE